MRRGGSRPAGLRLPLRVCYLPPEDGHTASLVGSSPPVIGRRFSVTALEEISKSLRIHHLLISTLYLCLSIIHVYYSEAMFKFRTRSLRWMPRIQYAITRPIVNVVIAVHAGKAIPAGSINKKSSRSDVIARIRQNTVQMILLIKREYLKETRSRGFPCCTSLADSFPPHHKAIRNAARRPMAGIPYTAPISMEGKPSPENNAGTRKVATTAKIPIGAPIR